MTNLNKLTSIFRNAIKSSPKSKPKPQASKASKPHKHDNQESSTAGFNELLDKLTSVARRPSASVLTTISNNTTFSANKYDEARIQSKDVVSCLQDDSLNIASTLEAINSNEDAFRDSQCIPLILDVPPKTDSQQRKITSRLRKEKWISVNSSVNHFKRLVSFCGQNLGTGAALDLLEKLGREAALKEYKAFIKVCLENARKSDDEDVVVEQISDVFKILQFMKEKDFPLDEGFYGPPLLYFIEMSMEEDFHFFFDIIKDRNGVSLPRLGYYEMLLYIRTNKEEKIQELCHYISTNDNDETTKLRENYLSALCDSDRKSDLLQLLDVIDITEVSSANNLANIFKSLGRLSLESYAKRFLVAFKERDYGAEKISNLIFKYASSAPNSAVEDVVSKFKNLHLLLEMKPDLKSYEELLLYCCKLNEVHLALDVVDQICEEGLVISECTLNLLLRAIEDTFEFQLVRRIYSLIHEKNLKPNGDTFKTLISFCVKMKRFDSAFAMLDDVKKFNVLPTASMYNVIMAGYFREKNPCAARKVLKQMKLADVEPDSQTYYYLISNCNCEKKISEYNEEMEHARIEKTKYTFVALISAYASCGKFDKAKEVILDPRIPGSNIDEIKSVLIFALASHGQLCDALTIYEEMKEAGLVVTPKAILALMEHCQSELDLNELLKLLEEVRTTEYWTSCCSRVLLYCLRNKHLSTAVDLLKQLKDMYQDNELAMEVLFDESFATIAEMDSPDLQFSVGLLEAIQKQIGASPSRKCLDFLLTASIKAKDVHHSRIIWKKYKEMGLPYNVMSYLGMYQALLAGGDHQSAKTLLSKIPTGDPDIQTVVDACQRTYPDPSTPVKGKENKKKKKKQ